ncbi:hypothetical protein V6N12_005723 [Hibiscus sabdariffa]|uniref:RNase H type-1 domain-containing protein n=1 Tax=Hibiscus sabdariffa TaxID=183260 RepID=A0ABR2AF66_9ROSI
MGSISDSRLVPLERFVPYPDWVILNVDGDVPMPMSSGSIGGLFRNCDGDWIMGFAKAVGHANSLQAELWALFEGLLLAWEQGFEKVLVRSDSKQTVDLVNSPSTDSSVLSLVRAIHRLRRHSWATIVSWVPRDDNRPADALAKLVDSSVFFFTCLLRTSIRSGLAFKL